MTNKSKNSVFVGNLEHRGGKKLSQQGAEFLAADAAVHDKTRSGAPGPTDAVGITPGKIKCDAHHRYSGRNRGK